MKKIYYLILLVASGFSLKAQFTVTSAANAVIGDIENTWQIDTLGLQTGSAGTGQIWNFTGITITPSLSIISETSMATAAAPNNSLYASANIAKTKDGFNYGMMGYTTNSIIVYGFTNSTISIVYQNPMVFATLPFVYGQVHSDTYSASYTFSGTPISETGTVTTTGDAYGTLNTPGNTYPNVFRIKLENLRVQNVGGTQTITTNSIDYVYLSTTGGIVNKNALLSINNTTQSTTASTVITKTKSGSVANNVLTGIIENQKNSSFSIYPNPSSGKEVTMSLAVNSTEKYTVSIYNTLGQEVKEIDLGNLSSGIHDQKLDVGDLQSGIYYVTLKGTNHQGVQKLIIE